MPARYLTLIAVLFLVPVCGHAQRGSATLQATVSQTVVLSALPNFTDENIDVFSSSGAVRVTLSSAATEFRVPLLVRSNCGFKLSAILDSQSAALTDLSVLDVRPTGSLVSSEVVNAIVRPEVTLTTPQPLFVLTGPRVSLGGTLQSPNNALQVTLLIRTQSLSPGQVVHLTFTATAAQLIQ
jgi:hypothetical protein